MESDSFKGDDAKRAYRGLIWRGSVAQTHVACICQGEVRSKLRIRGGVWDLLLPSLNIE